MLDKCKKNRIDKKLMIVVLLFLCVFCSVNSKAMYRFPSSEEHMRLEYKTNKGDVFLTDVEECLSLITKQAQSFSRKIGVYYTNMKSLDGNLEEYFEREFNCKLKYTVFTGRVHFHRGAAQFETRNFRCFKKQGKYKAIMLGDLLDIAENLQKKGYEKNICDLYEYIADELIPYEWK